MNIPDTMNTDSLDQKDFWDSLQLDILTSTQKLSNDDRFIFLERSLLFSLFFRSCSPLELINMQNLLNIKDNIYVILLEFTDPKATGLALDELKLHRFIKDTFKVQNCSVGPLVTNRISILVSEENVHTEQEYTDEKVVLCQNLVQELTAQFSLSIRSGIGSVQNIHSVNISFIEALASLSCSKQNSVVHYQSFKQMNSNEDFDYLEAEKHLIEAIRLRKSEAYDYFGLIMDWLRPLNDEAKRNRIFEILVLTNHAMRLDSQNEANFVNYSAYIEHFLELKGNQLIEYAVQTFIYITCYVKPQTSIDYSNNIVKATKDYLENHYTDDISLEEMAAQVNISPQYFSKLIKKTTGFNFIDWLSMLRVKKAKELLTNSSYTVKEVCFMVGYKDPNYFSRIFKKRMGITPSEYVKTSSYLNNKS